MNMGGMSPKPYHEVKRGVTRHFTNVHFFVNNIYALRVHFLRRRMRRGAEGAARWCSAQGPGAPCARMCTAQSAAISNTPKFPQFT